MVSYREKNGSRFKLTLNNVSNPENIYVFVNDDKELLLVFENNFEFDISKYLAP